MQMRERDDKSQGHVQIVGIASYNEVKGIHRLRVNMVKVNKEILCQSFAVPPAKPGDEWLCSTVNSEKFAIMDIENS